METKRNVLKEIILWAVIAIVVGLILWLLLYPVVVWTEKSEMRIYVRLFLLLFALNTFAVLRLYNSIVTNTRFTLKLREIMVKLQQSLPQLERLIRGVNNSISAVKGSADSLKKTVDANTDKTEKLTERLKQK